MAMGAAVAVWLAMTGVQLLPFVRSHQAEQRDLGQANQLLDQWFAQSSVDLRQRSYPSARLLANRAEAGDRRAQLILAWQLLLGAGGTVKDVASAGLWLEKGSAPAGQNSLWLAAKAVHVLNQDITPDAIRAAAADLHQAAERGVVEARFWEAGIYLEERGPAYDLKRGIQTLTQAADQRHARAALALGERFAKGQGVRRDTAAARRYLQIAALAGLRVAQTR
jgi:TPR repeat protein